MADLNMCQVIGRLGADPEMRYTANGSAVTTFNVASGRAWTGSDGEKREATTWFRVVAWQQLAEICAQYLAKGRQVYVQGRIEQRSWEGQDGQKRYSWELVAERVIFLGSNREGGGSSGFTPGLPVGSDGEGDVDPDDLPF